MGVEDDEREDEVGGGQEVQRAGRPAGQDPQWAAVINDGREDDREEDGRPHVGSTASWKARGSEPGAHTGGQQRSEKEGLVEHVVEVGGRKETGESKKKRR